MNSKPATTQWTIEKVKDKLPDIKVETPSGRILVGHVRGKKLQFASVWTEEGHCCEASWWTIANCLNTNSALRM
jgi:hypothetical protein